MATVPCREMQQKNSQANDAQRQHGKQTQLDQPILDIYGCMMLSKVPPNLIDRYAFRTILSDGAWNEG